MSQLTPFDGTINGGGGEGSGNRKPGTIRVRDGQEVGGDGAGFGSHGR